MPRQARLLVLIAVAAITVPATARQSLDIENAIARADSILDPFDRADAPGFSVAVVRGGRTLYARGLGMASLEQGVAIHPETIFDLGSVSKQLTAFAIVLLERDGLLDLDSDIRTILPEVPDFGSPITVRHLVHHMSGLREIYGALGMAGLRDGDGIVQKDALRLVTSSRELNFEPGTEYLYCNTAYMLLSDIVTRVAGTPFPEWMRTNVFEPLGMHRTVIMDRPGLVIPGAADSYSTVDSGGFRRQFDNSSITGAGGVYSTVHDMTLWMDNLLTGRIGGRDAVMRMRERGVLASGDTLTYAFGLSIGTYRGLDVISHNGASAGYRSRFMVLPAMQGGLVVLANRSDPPAEPIEAILDVFFGDMFEEETVQESGRAEDEPAPVTIDRTELLEYEGRYLSPELETVYTITASDSTLTVNHRRVDPITFQPMGGGVFDSGSYPMGTITFERDASGRVSSFRGGNGRVRAMRFVRID